MEGGVSVTSGKANEQHCDNQMCELSHESERACSSKAGQAGVSQIRASGGHGVVVEVLVDENDDRVRSSRTAILVKRTLTQRNWWGSVPKEPLLQALKLP